MWRSKGVHRLEANADKFEKHAGVSTLNSPAQASVPAARAVGKLVGELEHRSARLADKIAGRAASTHRVNPFLKARARKAA